jgi:hypothetical protein
MEVAKNGGDGLNVTSSYGFLSWKSIFFFSFGARHKRARALLDELASVLLRFDFDISASLSTNPDDSINLTLLLNLSNFHLTMTKTRKTCYYSSLVLTSNLSIDPVAKAKLRYSSLRDHHSRLVGVAFAIGLDSHHASLQARLRVALFGRLDLCPVDQIVSQLFRAVTVD